MDFNNLSPDDLQTLKDLFGESSPSLKEQLDIARQKGLESTLNKTLAEDIVSQVTKPATASSAAGAAEVLAPLVESVPSGAAGTAAGLAGLLYSTNTAGKNQSPLQKVGSEYGKDVYSQEGNPDLIKPSLSKPSDKFEDLKDILKNKSVGKAVVDDNENDESEEPSDIFTRVSKKYQDLQKEGRLPETLKQVSPSALATSFSPKELSPAASISQALVNQDMSTVEGLKDAQQRAAVATLINQLGAAGQTIGESIAKVPAGSKEAWNTNIKLAQQFPEQYKQQIEMQKNDPNSPLSLTMKKILKEKFGFDVPPGFAAAHSDTILKVLEADSAAKARIEANKLQRQAMMDQRSIMQEQRKQMTAGRLEQQAESAMQKHLGDTEKQIVNIDRYNVLLNDIKSGKLQDTPQILAQLQNFQTDILKGRNAFQSDQAKMEVDTLANKAAKLQQEVMNKPYSSVVRDFIPQMEKESDLLRNQYLSNYKDRSDALISATSLGTKKDYIKQQRDSNLAIWNAKKSTNDYNSAQEAGISNVMSKLNITREEAIKQLKNAGRL